ncbi:MAG: formyltransferase family protein, partial [Ignavibacteria bacterium]|nr:formyltransferase family protein [Ignavibacteria bacterium]
EEELQDHTQYGGCIAHLNTHHGQVNIIRTFLSVFINMLNKNRLSEQIAYISINPSGKFMKSAQVGFDKVGLRPKFLIYVSPGGRIKKEFKKYRLGLFTQFLFPKFKQHFGNKQGFSSEVINIPIMVTHKVASLNSDETLKFIADNKIKYLINCGAGIFRKKITSIEGIYIINAHAGKLPEYRNMNVVEWAMLNGEPAIGTIHLIDSGIDTGPILYEEELQINGADNLVSARETAFDQVIQLAGKTVLAHAEGKLNPQSQPKKGKKWYTMHPFFKDKLNRKLASPNR